MIEFISLTVLLISGSTPCLGLPQYQVATSVDVQPPKVSQVEQAPIADVEVIEGSDGGFTSQHQQALKDYWWKVSGVFAGEGEFETSGSDQSAGGDRPSFTPHQSSFCETGFDCVPWGICVEGYIALDGGPVLQQRSKPSNYDTLSCGQEGNICCGIPKEVLEVQKQNVEGVIVEHHKEKSVNAEKTLPHVDGSGKPVAGEYGCSSSNHDCIPHYQCVDGVVNTDGAGLLDLRVKPTSNCKNPDYLDEVTVCCLVPGKEVHSERTDACPSHQECVENNLCSGGKIVTDGSGLLDLRTGHKKCSLPSGSSGVCCSPPGVHLETCPEGSVCTIGSECQGHALDASNNFVNYATTGEWSHCSYENQQGVCCKLPTRLVDSCPQNSLCVSKDKCNGRALNHDNEFINYIQGDSWMSCTSEANDGICCIASEDLTTPEILDSCPGESKCVLPGDCKGSALNSNKEFVSYDSQVPWTQCSKYSQGVCCLSSNREDILTPSGECGIRNYNIDQRITISRYEVNEASFGEFPWQSIIFYKNYTFNCGATLISDRHLLTAAHCVDDLGPEDIRIRLGDWQVNSFDEPLPYVDRYVQAIFIHPKFNPANVHNDIAVLQLQKPVTLKYHINNVCLPGPDQVFEPYTKCFATGWGKDSFKGNFQHILKKIDLPYVDHETCQSLLRKTRLGNYFKLDPSFMCAGGEENKDACYGDGGGPLVCKDPATSRYILMGITSWGIGCGSKDVPGVYADVKYFSGWINEALLGKLAVHHSATHDKTLGEHKQHGVSGDEVHAHQNVPSGHAGGTLGKPTGHAEVPHDHPSGHAEGIPVKPTEHAEGPHDHPTGHDEGIPVKPTEHAEGPHDHPTGHAEGFPVKSNEHVVGPHDHPTGHAEGTPSKPSGHTEGFPVKSNEHVVGPHDHPTGHVEGTPSKPSGHTEGAYDQSSATGHTHDQPTGHVGETHNEHKDPTGEIHSHVGETVGKVPNENQKHAEEVHGHQKEHPKEAPTEHGGHAGGDNNLQKEYAGEAHSQSAGETHKDQVGEGHTQHSEHTHSEHQVGETHGSQKEHTEVAHSQHGGDGKDVHIPRDQPGDYVGETVNEHVGGAVDQQKQHIHTDTIEGDHSQQKEFVGETAHKHDGHTPESVVGESGKHGETTAEIHSQPQATTDIGHGQNQEAVKEHHQQKQDVQLINEQETVEILEEQSPQVAPVGYGK